MTRSLVLAVTAIAAVFGAGVPVLAIDYPVNIPENVRLVQKTTVNARTFTKVQSAINDCVAKMGAKLKATNRCVVKVGPGTWNGVVAMHSFVDVEGAGDDTIITSAAAITGAIYSTTPFTTATVKMAQDAELRDLKVRNTSPTGGIAVLFDNVAGRATEVTAETVTACGQASAGLGDSIAIAVQGPSAVATLSRVKASVVNTNTVDPKGDNAAVVSIRGGKLTMEDSSVSTTGSYEMGISCYDHTEAGTGSNGSVELRDVVVEVAKGGRVFSGDDATCAVTVRNSVLRARECATSPGGTAFVSAGLATITGSELVDCACGFSGDGVKVSGSLVDQRSLTPCTYGAARIVGSWDTEYEAVVYPLPAP